ncbi:BRO1-domain-containing protein [Metschnikowia bicuspidata var. bicuspidata NRRL YB-4993]|uniref:BRO domain-containing protein 1 n=1 Tax=Metschnikowia bicuspidata var. bicuspidata NRRL YB-4993 TaxID=869754 RepID=A0A1A0HJW4_9ASCO|nr:BRO1-domain-containing protein [Metschnikowia bicuspidata var. bicuspidata NRRL YB-4993]OBA24291.1 BRO1-domain-containing protein [Metschnikowia bicuspidata var. bicuspidata NRRL YB-4993]
MKALLLSAPIKTTEETNWSKPLNNYLLSVYGNTSEFQGDLKKLNELRKAVQAIEATELGSSVENCLTYYSQLELLDLRIKMLALLKRKQIKFTWSDAFSPSAESTQTALPFEKASVLFNLGSLLMKAAGLKYSDAFKSTSADLGEKEFKDAIQSMQQAAGVFQYISESFLHGPLSDLKPVTIKFLEGLCLAQSQEIFTLKVIDGDLEQKKNSLIAKLCASAAKYYEDCHRSTAHLMHEDEYSVLGDYGGFTIKETGLDDEVLDLENQDDELLADYDPESSEANSTKVPAHLNASWVAIFRAKHLYYKSSAYYFQGLQLEATKKFGESIACLTKSSEVLGQITSGLLESVGKSKGHNVYDFLDNIEYHKDALRIKLADLTKDNDLIYHDIVPSLVTLAEPKAMNSVKVLQMSKIEAFMKINENNYNTFLNNVVPITIHELLSFYSEEKSQFLRNELDAVDVSNEELSSALEYLNLPQALVSIKEITCAEKPLEYGSCNSYLDPDTLGKVLEISSNYSQDTTNRSTIVQYRREIMDCVNKGEALLNSAPSSASEGQFRDDLIKLKKSLYEAANSDTRLFSLIDDENSSFYHTLGKGVSSTEFKSLFLIPDFNKVDETNSQEPEISLLDVDDSQLKKLSVRIEDKINWLEDLLNELNIVKAKKAKLISELKKEIHNDDISDILLINSRVKSTEEIKSIIFPEELKKFEVFLNSLNSLLDQQKSLMEDVKKQWEDLISSPKVKNIQASSTFRTGLLNEQKSKIDWFYENNWRKYTAGLQRGVGFYHQLLEYARSLCNTLEKQLQTGLFTQSMGSLSLGENVTGGSFGSQTSQATPRFFAAPGQGMGQQQGWSTHVNSGAARRQQAQWTAMEPKNGERLNEYPTAFLSGTPNAPQLPPKRPSQSSFTGQYGLSNAAVSHSPDTNAQKAKPSSDFNPGPRNPRSSSELIYDQPSTYLPNMYDFFAQNRG